jgi:hypothetical protein
MGTLKMISHESVMKFIAHCMMERDTYVHILQEGVRDKVRSETGQPDGREDLIYELLSGHTPLMSQLIRRTETSLLNLNHSNAVLHVVSSSSPEALSTF